MPTCCTDMDFERFISQNTSKLILAYVSFFCSMLRVLHGTGVILLAGPLHAFRGSGRVARDGILGRASVEWSICSGAYILAALAFVSGC